MSKLKGIPADNAFDSMSLEQLQEHLLTLPIKDETKAALPQFPKEQAKVEVLRHEYIKIIKQSVVSGAVPLHDEELYNMTATELKREAVVRVLGKRRDLKGYICSVSVLKAEGLLAMDQGGTSDPFAKVYYGGKSNVIGKTNVVKKTLSPVWQPKVFKFDLTDNAEVDEIVIEVLDADVLKSKAIGTKSINLDNVQTGDHWFTLDPAPGNAPNCGRVLINLSLKALAAKPPSVSNILKLFRQLDKKSTGFVTLWGFEKIQREHGVFVPLTEIQSEATNDKLTFAQVLSLMSIFTKPTVVPLNVLELLFVAADSQATGGISQEKAMQILQQCELPQQKPKKSFSITFEEFCELVPEPAFLFRKVLPESVLRLVFDNYCKSRGLGNELSTELHLDSFCAFLELFPRATESETFSFADILDMMKPPELQPLFEEFRNCEGSASGCLTDTEFYALSRGVATAVHALPGSNNDTKLTFVEICKFMGRDTPEIPIPINVLAELFATAERARSDISGHLTPTELSAILRKCHLPDSTHSKSANFTAFLAALPPVEHATRKEIPEVLFLEKFQSLGGNYEAALDANTALLLLRYFEMVDFLPGQNKPAVPAVSGMTLSQLEDFMGPPTLDALQEHFAKIDVACTGYIPKEAVYDIARSTQKQMFSPHPTNTSSQAKLTLSDVLASMKTIHDEPELSLNVLARLFAAHNLSSSTNFVADATALLEQYDIPCQNFGSTSTSGTFFDFVSMVPPATPESRKTFSEKVVRQVFEIPDTATGDESEIRIPQRVTPAQVHAACRILQIDIPQSIADGAMEDLVVDTLVDPFSLDSVLNQFGEYDTQNEGQITREQYHEFAVALGFSVHWVARKNRRGSYKGFGFKPSRTVQPNFESNDLLSFADVVALTKIEVPDIPVHLNVLRDQFLQNVLYPEEDYKVISGEGLQRLCWACGLRDMSDPDMEELGFDEAADMLVGLPFVQLPLNVVYHKFNSLSQTNDKISPKSALALIALLGGPPLPPTEQLSKNLSFGEVCRRATSQLPLAQEPLDRAYNDFKQLDQQQQELVPIAFLEEVMSFAGLVPTTVRVANIRANLLTPEGISFQDFVSMRTMKANDIETTTTRVMELTQKLFGTKATDTLPIDEIRRLVAAHGSIPDQEVEAIFNSIGADALDQQELLTCLLAS